MHVNEEKISSRVKTDNYAIDDLHQAALAEFEARDNALASLLANLLYADTRSRFYASLEHLRELTAEDEL